MMESRRQGENLGSFLKLGFFFFFTFIKPKKYEVECFTVLGEHDSHTVNTGFTATCAFPSFPMVLKCLEQLYHGDHFSVTQAKSEI